VELLTVPLDERLCLFHLAEKWLVADNACGISYFTASFIETGDAADDRALRYIRQFGNLFKRL
jgi:hypothetical protein